jgi:hypothetical protein
MDNLGSNLTRIWTCFVSIVRYQETCIWMSNGFMNAPICFEEVNSSKETRRSWYHVIDTKYVHILVKFEPRLSIQFGRKKRETKSFSRAWLNTFFLEKNASFLRTEINNLRSNLTRIWTCFVSIAWYQKTCIWMTNGSMNATIRLKKATDGSGIYVP